MSETIQGKAEREAKVLAVSAAEFKVEEARFFLAKATEATQNARDFRFYFDAALDAIDSAKEIARDIVGKDPVLSKVVERRLRTFSEEPGTKIVISNRVAAHHRSKRAALRGVIEAGMAVTDLSLHDHVEYVHVLRRGMQPRDQRLTWTLRDGSEHYDALGLSEQVLTGVGSIIADIRARMDLGPDKGLKRFTIQILEAPPSIHRSAARESDRDAPQVEAPGEGGRQA